jgi:hypothetical protein
LNWNEIEIETWNEIFLSAYEELSEWRIKRF